jgi:hypothetical protein
MWREGSEPLDAPATLPLVTDMVDAVQHRRPAQNVFEVHAGVLKLVCKRISQTKSKSEARGARRET